MGSENLRRLKELTPRLGMTNPGSDYIEYNTEDNGEFIGFGLFKIPTIAVQRVFMSKGTKIPEHAHPEREYCIVYKGKFELYNPPSFGCLIDGESTRDTGKDKKIFGPGDGAYFQPNELHGGTMLEDTWIISITIPASEVYPDA